MSWRRSLIYALVPTLAAVLLVVGILAIGGHSANDFDPNQACAAHNGVHQVSISDGYTLGVVCRDGRYVNNPYD